LVLIHDEGDLLTTQFRGFQAPIGMALCGDRVASVPTSRSGKLINGDETSPENSFTEPDEAPADVPASLRGPAEPTRGAAGSGGDGSMPRGPLVMA
jgi:hypothetical protein